MATHSCILAWKIPWTEEPGRLQSMGLQRIRHDWVTSLSLSLSLSPLPIWQIEKPRHREVRKGSEGHTAYRTKIPTNEAWSPHCQVLTPPLCASFVWMQMMTLRTSDQRPRAVHQVTWKSLEKRLTQSQQDLCLQPNKHPTSISSDLVVVAGREPGGSPCGFDRTPIQAEL